VQGNNAANNESEDIMRDTFEMAREAGLEITVDPTETPLRTFVEGWDDQLKAFEALVRADERAASVQDEACNKPTDAMVDAATNEYDEWSKDNQGTTECIRAMLVKSMKAAPAPEPLTDDQVDAATKAWFENDIVAGQNPFRKRMRAAFAAAHGITEKGD
jgi:hypothetical protein